MRFLLVMVFALAATSSSAHGQTKRIRELQDTIQQLKIRLDKLEREKVPPRRAAPRKRPKAQTDAYKIPIGDSPILGNKNAPVALVIFNDFQCPFCQRVQSMLEAAVKDPELKGKIKVVFKQFPLPFHKNAKPAAKAALAAREQGDDKFWAMSAKLYADQRSLSSESYSRWAMEIGLNVPKFEQDLRDNDAKYEALIKADIKLGVNAAKVRGTPSIFINGWTLQKRSVEGIKELIKAKKLLTGG